MHNSSGKFHVFIYLDVRSRNVWFCCSPETKTMTYLNLPGFNASAGNWNHEIWSTSFGVGTSIQTTSTLSMLATLKVYHIVHSFPNEWLGKAAAAKMVILFCSLPLSYQGPSFFPRSLCIYRIQICGVMH